MVIRDGPGFLALNHAIKHLQKRPNFELVVVSNDVKRDNMEFHLKYDVSTLLYHCEFYESHDKHPYHFTSSYHNFMLKRKQDHFKFIKMINGDKSVMLYQEPKNPDQLKVSTESGPFMYPGECMICGESDYRNGLFCRVNCPAGHVFHCDCINRWRNTPQVNPYFEMGWQNNCPICRAPIDTINTVRPQNGAFGKSSMRSMKRRNGKAIAFKSSMRSLRLINNEIKNVKNDISYLSKKGLNSI